MASKFLQSLAALALIAAPLPAFAQAGPDTTSTAETAGPSGAGLWVGILMSAVVLGVVIWHNDLFGNDHNGQDRPVSP
jgi:hypothetical protein